MFRVLKRHQLTRALALSLTGIFTLGLTSNLGGGQKQARPVATYSVDVYFVDSQGNPQEKPSYTINGQAAPNGDVTPNYHDAVKWQVHTVNKDAHLFIVQPGAVLDDPNGPGREFLDASEGSYTGHGTVRLNQKKTYQYYVVAFDPKDGHIYGDDPKIKVGGGGPTDPTGELKKLKKDLEKIEASGGPDVKAQLQKSIELLDKVLHQLQ